MMKVPLAIAKEMVCGSNCCEDNFIRTSFTVACLLLPFPIKECDYTCDIVFAFLVVDGPKNK